MNKHSILLSVLAVGTLLTGCAGTGPNTQQGAVTGGLLGAVAGAVIGNNSRGGNSVGGALIGGTIGALAGGTMGNAVDHREGTLYGNYNQAYQSRVATQQAPPSPPPLPTVPETMSGTPPANALWIPGYWSYSGNAYFWVAGHWEVPPPNVRSYITAHWERQGHHFYWIPSYWQ